MKCKVLTARFACFNTPKLPLPPHTAVDLPLTCSHCSSASTSRVCYCSQCHSEGIWSLPCQSQLCVLAICLWSSSLTPLITNFFICEMRGKNTCFSYLTGFSLKSQVLTSLHILENVNNGRENNEKVFLFGGKKKTDQCCPFKKCDVAGIASADSPSGHISMIAAFLLTNHTSDRCGLSADVLCLLLQNYFMWQKMFNNCTSHFDKI